MVINFLCDSTSYRDLLSETAYQKPTFHKLIVLGEGGVWPRRQLLKMKTGAMHLIYIYV